MASIGALFANLTFETAAFDKGIDRATAKMSGLQKHFSAIGGKIAGIGGKLSLGITAPIAGIAAAFADSAREMAASVGDIEKAAQLSGASFEGFQKMAYAAKSVGIESDNLADIFKDVNDKFGEFAATGGGELKDFFENIAPKVGLTAESFKKLSGPEALQAYYSALEKAGLSQQQITFYMEALANDATALAPLLRDNGKAMDELGQKAAVIKPEDAERMKAYTQANRDLDTAMQKLTIAVVNSGLLDAITALVTKFADWAGGLAKTNPELLKWGAGIAAAAATLGPAVAGIGGMVAGFGKLLPLFSKILPFITIIPGPIGLIATAASAAFLVWQNWDKITAIVKRLYDGVKTWLVDKLGPVFSWLSDKIGWVADRFKWLDDVVVRHSYVPDMVDSIGDHMRRLQQEMVDPTDKATKSTAEKFKAMAEKVSGILDGLYPETAALREELEKLATLEADPKVPYEAIMKQRQRVADAEKRSGDERLPGTLDRPEWSTAGEIQPVAGVPEAVPQMERAVQVGLSLRDAFDQIGGKAGTAFADIADSLLNSVIPALDRTGDRAMMVQSQFSSMGNAFGQLVGMIFGRKAGRVAGALGTLAGAFGGFRANGGPVSAGKSYIVGERGPELFTSRASGHILSSEQLRTGIEATSAGGGFDQLAIAA